MRALPQVVGLLLVLLGVLHAQGQPSPAPAPSPELSGEARPLCSAEACVNSAAVCRLALVAVARRPPAARLPFSRPPLLLLLRRGRAAADLQGWHHQLGCGRSGTRHPRLVKHVVALVLHVVWRHLRHVWFRQSRDDAVSSLPGTACSAVWCNRCNSVSQRHARQRRLALTALPSTACPALALQRPRL